MKLFYLMATVILVMLICSGCKFEKTNKLITSFDKLNTDPSTYLEQILNIKGHAGFRESSCFTLKHGYTNNILLDKNDYFIYIKSISGRAFQKDKVYTINGIFFVGKTSDGTRCYVVIEGAKLTDEGEPVTYNYTPIEKTMPKVAESKDKVVEQKPPQTYNNENLSGNRFLDLFFCDNGKLVANISSCKCPLGQILWDDTCTSNFRVGPKTIKLEYQLKGETDTIEFIAYEGFKIYDVDKTTSYVLSALPPETPLDEVIRLTIAEPKRNLLNDNDTIIFMLSLIDEIQGRTSDREEQAQIAMSLVQHIPYGDVQELAERGRQKTPYETLYDMNGVCGDKSLLLAFLLKELGFGTSLIEGYITVYEPGRTTHAMTGVKCPKFYSLNESGFCPIETTSKIAKINEIKKGFVLSKITNLSSGYSFTDIEDGIVYSDYI